MTALLTDNLPLLAGSPNGIKKLRELILELAVRGKLVPQDPNDEPASELLKRIVAEKACLVAEGKIKKLKSLPDVEALEKLYGLPAGWEWTTLPGAANYKIGKTPPTKEAKYWADSGLPWVSISDMEHYGEITETSRRVSIAASTDIFKYQPIPAGTLLMSFKLTVGKVAVLGIDAYHNEAIISLSPYNGVSKDYLFRFLPSIALGGQQKNALMGNTLNSESMSQLLIPIPPLAEQLRIVAKVDELMALCDRLEVQHADAESAHAQLVQALLDSLTQTSDVADFAASWQRLAEHFHTLFTSGPSIDALKKTLLQLAVMGKLVPQNPSDEPADELLKRITEEKARLIAEGIIKKQKPLEKIGEEESFYKLPDSWAWARLGSQVTESSAGWSPSCEPWRRAGDEWGVLKVSAVSWGVYQPDENKALPANLDARPEYEVVENDFLISRANTAELVARSVIVGSTPSRLMLSDKIVRLKLTSLCERRYVNLANGAPLARDYYSLVAGGTSSSMKNVSREQILNLLIALPPLEEQHRIVAKIDQLMIMCDQLKARLNQAHQLNEQLTSTLVEQAVT